MLLRHEHHFELFLVVETIKVWRSSLQDLFDLSIRPCVVGVLGAPCLAERHHDLIAKFSAIVA